jgi:hypothetical protein
MNELTVQMGKNRQIDLEEKNVSSIMEENNQEEIKNAQRYHTENILQLNRSIG